MTVIASLYGVHMSLKYAVLSALLEGEASGYDLAKIFDVSVSNFWAATPQQLYRELDRLTADGLIDARVVPQERRPNKRMFTLSRPAAPTWPRLRSGNPDRSRCATNSW